VVLVVPEPSSGGRGEGKSGSPSAGDHEVFAVNEVVTPRTQTYEVVQIGGAAAGPPDDVVGRTTRSARRSSDFVAAGLTPRHLPRFTRPVI